MGTGAGNAEKDTPPQAAEWGGAGKRAGGPRFSGPRPPRNELYPVSVLRVRTSRLFGEPSPSRFPRVGSACTILLHPSLAGTLSVPVAGTLLPLTIAGISTAECLSSLGDSPRPPPASAIYSTVANLALGYAVS